MVGINSANLPEIVPDASVKYLLFKSKPVASMLAFKLIPAPLPVNPLPVSDQGCPVAGLIASLDGAVNLPYRSLPALMPWLIRDPVAPVIAPCNGSPPLIAEPIAPVPALVTTGLTYWFTCPASVLSPVLRAEFCSTADKSPPLSAVVPADVSALATEGFNPEGSKSAYDKAEFTPLPNPAVSPP